MSQRYTLKIVAGAFLLIIPILLLFTYQSSVQASEKTIDRISGDNRYGTSVEVSKKGWPNGSKNVVISVGNNFPDALSGAPLAYSLDAPILLASHSFLSSEVRKEIERLNAEYAYILGGENVISDEVEDILGSMGLMVKRISGRNRYETAAKIAKNLNGESPIAIIAYGNNFPDSLSIAPFASQKGIPILLVEKDYIPTETKLILKNYKQTLVIGGEAVISKKVFNQLPEPTRISGSNRYETGAKVVREFSDTSENSYIATGQAFSDALTGAVLAAKEGAPILLVEKEYVPSDIFDIISMKNFNKFHIVGGKSVVSEQISKMLYFDKEGLLKTAKSLKGIPYVYGGFSLKGFDCSGFIKYVYGKHGFQLPRTTREMWDTATKVNQPSLGDLVFFETYKTGPSHAGIYVGNNEFIHASTSRGVTIDSLDNSYFKPRYLGSKRVF